MRNLVIGKGEIGRVLMSIFECPGVDKNETVEGNYDIIHVAFPYSKDFISEVRKYQDLYKPKYTVIHSTVKPGTSRELGATHSPVIGLHPHLKESLKSFTKYLSGEKASEIADIFRRAGIKVYLFDKPETTELMKILDTTFYGLCIEYTKNIREQCKELDIPFEAWTIWTENYNQGYQKLGYSEYTRPNLVPIMTKQGGHCTVPNLELVDTVFTRFLKLMNK